MHDIEESALTIWALSKGERKYSVSPGAYHRSGPQTIGRFGANSSGDDCTPHREEEKTRNLQEAQVSQRRTLSFLAG